MSCISPFLLRVFGISPQGNVGYKKLDREISPKEIDALKTMLSKLTDLDPSKFERCSDLNRELKNRFDPLKQTYIDGNVEELVCEKLIESAKKSEQVRLYYKDSISRLQGDPLSLQSIKQKLIITISIGV